MIAHSRSADRGGQVASPGTRRWPRSLRARGATAAEVALAWLLSLSPAVVAIPGPAGRRPLAPQPAPPASCSTNGDRESSAGRSAGRVRPRPAPSSPSDAEVVLVMGIPGAGKTRIAEEYAARGYLRLNRDERGGTLRDLAQALEQGAGVGNATDRPRQHVPHTGDQELRGRDGRPARRPRACIWLDTPLAQAQVNLVERLLERFGTLPTPGELRLAREEPGMLAPTSQMRASASSSRRRRTRASPPSSRCRSRAPRERAAGVFVAAAALAEVGAATTPRRRTSSSTGAPRARRRTFRAHQDLAEKVHAPVETALCPHGGGPPVCWCRPPLPGLPLAFARNHDIDPARSTLVGTATAHRTLANALGARYVAV